MAAPASYTDAGTQTNPHLPTEPIVDPEPSCQCRCSQSGCALRKKASQVENALESEYVRDIICIELDKHLDEIHDVLFDIRRRQWDIQRRHFDVGEYHRRRHQHHISGSDLSTGNDQSNATGPDPGSRSGTRAEGTIVDSTANDSDADGVIRGARHSAASPSPIRSRSIPIVYDDEDYRGVERLRHRYEEGHVRQDDSQYAAVAGVRIAAYRGPPTGEIRQIFESDRIFYD